MNPAPPVTSIVSIACTPSHSMPVVRLLGYQIGFHQRCGRRLSGENLRWHADGNRVGWDAFQHDGLGADRDIVADRNSAQDFRTRPISTRFPITGAPRTPVRRRPMVTPLRMTTSSPTTVSPLTITPPK